jgi:mRNA interferase RelE/StbE
LKYRLVYTHRALKDIEKLTPNLRKRIGNTLKRYEKDPMQYSEKITDKRLGQYRIRIGDYRVIFDVNGQELIILRVGHRREIYRR